MQNGEALRDIRQCIGLKRYETEMPRHAGGDAGENHWILLAEGRNDERWKIRAVVRIKKVAKHIRFVSKSIFVFLHAT